MKSGHSLMNTAALLICLLTFGALVLPAIAAQRDKARAAACATNLRKIGLAMHNYHAAYKRLPMALSGSIGGATLESGNQGRLGPLVAILPFIEQQGLWEKISSPYTDKESNQTFPPMGPVPWYDAGIYKPWGQGGAVYACPERDSKQRDAKPRIVYTLRSDSDIGVMTNYVGCHGDGTLNVGKATDLTSKESVVHARATKRGIFVSGMTIKFRDCLDGLANTILFSETQSSVKGGPGLSGIVKGIEELSRQPSLCLAVDVKDPQVQWWPMGRGSRWCDGQLAISGFQTVLPPNSLSCSSENGIDDVIVSASSYHEGGAHVLMADGSTIFVSDQVDTGDSDSPGVATEEGYLPPGSGSPYGIWGAMGTRASKEVLPRNFGTVDGIEKIDFPRGAARATTGNEFSNWSERSGNASLNAKFVRVIDRKTIELEDANGVLHRVALNTLRDRDIYRAVSAQVAKEK